MITLLLSLPLAGVLVDRLVVVKVFFAKSKRLKSRRCGVSALALLACQLNWLLHFVDFLIPYEVIIIAVDGNVDFVTSLLVVVLWLDHHADLCGTGWLLNGLVSHIVWG